MASPGAVSQDNARHLHSAGVVRVLEVDGLEPVACSVGVLGSPPAGKAGGVMEHDLTVVRPVLRGRSMTYIAECSCGWESRELSTAGMAQSARDAHVTEVTRE